MGYVLTDAAVNTSEGLVVVVVVVVVCVIAAVKGQETSWSRWWRFKITVMRRVVIMMNFTTKRTLLEKVLRLID